MSTLIALILPAVLLPALLVAAGERSELPRLFALSTWPVELWILVISGAIATVAGVLDWSFHRYGGRRIPRAEHRAELMALALGLPLFGLLIGASSIANPSVLLVPIVGLALAIAGLIVFDETRFHRTCGRYETALHRLLVGGNGIAFLAWMHWCFTREHGIGA